MIKGCVWESHVKIDQSDEFGNMSKEECSPKRRRMYHVIIETVQVSTKCRLQTENLNFFSSDTSTLLIVTQSLFRHYLSRSFALLWNIPFVLFWDLFSLRNWSEILAVLKLKFLLFHKIPFSTVDLKVSSKTSESWTNYPTTYCYQWLMILRILERFSIMFTNIIFRAVKEKLHLIFSWSIVEFKGAA